MKFQSKRLQDYGNWETYYFGWRDYDPELGRWFVVDPARQFASPYVAMGNNPIIGYDEDGQVAWFVPLLIAGAVNVIIDVGMEYAISQSLNQPFEYSFTDALKSFFQGAALQEFSIASKAGKLGKFAEKLMVKNGIGWSLLRGVTTSFIYSSIDITVDVIDAKLKDKKLGNEYFKNKAIGFGIQSIANGIVDNSIEKLKLKPDEAINDLPKKGQKFIKRSVEKGKFKVEYYDFIISFTYDNKLLQSSEKYAINQLKTEFYKKLYKKMGIATIINTMNEYIYRININKTSKENKLKKYNFYNPFF